jgi:hypothetical protein
MAERSVDGMVDLDYAPSGVALDLPGSERAERRE